MEFKIHYEKNMADAFQRQRRNLMLISIVLIMHQLAKVTISEGPLFNGAVKISDPNGISIGLWILWVYWLIRYVHLFRMTPAFQELADAWIESSKSIMLSRALKSLRKDRAFMEGLKTDGGLEKPTLKFVREESSVRFERLTGWTVNGYYEAEDAKSPRGVMGYTEPINLPLGKTKARAVFGALKLVITDYSGFEYVLPFVVAAMPALIIVCRSL
jgi:hypothetical protein